MSVISMKQFLEAGVHFGHQTRKWNPKMKKYIFTSRNDIHIINLEQTTLLVDSAYKFVRDIVASGKSVLFVGTKKQAQEAVKEEALRCGMFYVNTRWLGGCLTNLKTIKKSIERLNKLNQMEKVGEFNLLTKKEVSILKAERDKLEANLSGIKDMRDYPGVIFVVDPSKEHICVKEAIILKIPIVALVDTNCDPTGIDHVIPGNDDAIRSVKLITSAIADACIEAREGVSAVIKPKDVTEEDVLDLKSILAEVKPNVELAESEDENKSKKKKNSNVKKDVKKLSENKTTEQNEVKKDSKTENQKETKNIKKETEVKIASEAKPAKDEKKEKQTEKKTTKEAK